MNAQIAISQSQNAKQSTYFFYVCQVVQEYGRGTVEASSLDEARELIEALVEEGLEDIDWYESKMVEQIDGADIHDETGQFIEAVDL